MSAIMAVGKNPPGTFQAKVVDVRSISHDVYRVELQLPQRRELSFHAGQYLSVNLPDAEPSYFSIASSPSAQNIELHIQATPEWVSAQKVIDALTSGGEVTVELPHGKACLGSAPAKPLLLVAAGTGFAQMKSLVDYLRETSYSQPVKLYWGVRRHEDMYLRSLAQQWQEDWPPFTFLPVVGDPLCAIAGWLRLPFWRSSAWMMAGKFVRYCVMTILLLWVPDGWWMRLFAPFSAAFAAG